jgi:hypothetical protein
VGRASVGGRRGIMRASVPANAESACVCSFRRQPRPRLTPLRGRRFIAPAPFISLMLGLIMAVHSCALPVPLVFLFADAKASLVTKGCKKMTCCTPLCYVDKHGIHHCVHMSGDSCACGLSNDGATVDLQWFLALGTPPGNKEEMPALVPGNLIAQILVPIETYEPATPVPPPK